MSDIERFSDEWLDACATGLSRGDKNAAPYLRPFTPDERRRIVAEAHTLSNMVPGFNYSGAVWQAAKTYTQTGTFPYGERARQYARDEQDLNNLIRSHNPGAERVTLYPLGA